LDSHAKFGQRSAGAIARALGVNSKSVVRWLRGDDIPAPATVESINTWLKEERDRVKAEQKAARKSVSPARPT